MYRYMSRESCSQFDSLPLTSLTIFLIWKQNWDTAVARNGAPWRLGKWSAAEEKRLNDARAMLRDPALLVRSAEGRLVYGHGGIWQRHNLIALSAAVGTRSPKQVRGRLVILRKWELRAAGQPTTLKEETAERERLCRAPTQLPTHPGQAYGGILPQSVSVF